MLSISSERPEKSLHYITSFYLFVPIEEPALLKKKLQNMAQSYSMEGLVILATEGINATLSFKSKKDRDRAKEAFKRTWLIPLFKDSLSHRPPFGRFSVKIRKEIVTLKEDLTPIFAENHQSFLGKSYLSPKEWHKKLYENGNEFPKDKPLILDVRNWYESRLGTFKGALLAQLRRFSQFPAFLKAQALPKDKEICIFCTGGIRCEKALLELKRQGYKKCYQLQGGILSYLQDYPHQGFKGECFVFDRRVSVQQSLHASEKYQLCPHCGQPAHQKITCRHCNEEHQLLCQECFQIPVLKDTCSKNCAYHYAKNQKIPQPKTLNFYLDKGP